MNESRKKFSLSRRAMVAALILCPLAVLVGRPYFIRERTIARMNSCICNLRQIDGAIQQWALEQKKTPDDKVAWKDLTSYLKNEVKCPGGGAYTIGPTILSQPKCSIAGHALPP